MGRLILLLQPSSLERQQQVYLNWISFHFDRDAINKESFLKEKKKKLEEIVQPSEGMAFNSKWLLVVDKIKLNIKNVSSREKCSLTHSLLAKKREKKKKHGLRGEVS